MLSSHNSLKNFPQIRKLKPKDAKRRNSLEVHWLRPSAFMAGAQGQSLVEELRSCKPQRQKKNFFFNMLNEFPTMQTLNTLCGKAKPGLLTSFTGM